MLRENVGRVAVILAGGGCLALMMFVVWPQLFEPAPSMTPDQIVEEVLGPEGDPPGETQAGTDEMVMPVPSPLVAVRDDGEALPVIFPAPEGQVPEAREAGESAAVEAVLPPVLSAEDIAAAAAALEGEEEEAAEGVGPVDSEDGMTPEDWVRVASAPDVEPLEPEEGQAAEAAADTVPVEPEPMETTAAEVIVEPQADAAKADGVAERHPANGAPDHDAGAGDAESAVAGYEAAREAGEVAEAPVEAPEAVDVATATVLPAGVTESQAPREAPDPSGGPSGPAAREAGQAGGPESGLSPRMAEVERKGAVVPGTLRGVMGYRLPLVSRQEVPDQIVSGVLIPAHTTFVILKEGSWELVDVSAAELELLRQLAAEREAAAAAEPEPEPEKPGWNPLRMLRKQEAPAHE